jgi:ABC-2 type transport system permease protein
LIRDYRSLYLAFAIPLLLIILFGYALSLDVDHVETVFVDYDKSELSRDFIRNFGASSYFHVSQGLSQTKDAINYLDHDRAKVAIVIPPNFMKSIRADRETPLQIIIDGSDPTFGNIIRGYIISFTEQYNQKMLLSFIIPGIIAIIIMIVGAILTSLIIAREYEDGTMETIKSMPVRAGELLLGKAIPYFFIGLTNVLIAILLGQLLFGIVMKGNFWLMIVSASLYLSVALSLGMLISIVTKSQLMANQIAILTTYLPSLLLSNFVFPVINMPKFLQMLTLVVPATYFIDILSGIYLRNVGFAYLWPSMLVLALMFTALTTANYILLKKEGL